ncbi:hypothetical protein TCON_0320 [Astathelohania contejeani]|uniref:DNA polymerase alpha subunit B n=1 Tax=Astathelohania contejeani TaxID=164912 RepID=A0ABQ7I221_9MICR|nr:hypothetical protein TCON_0320 [Thelohania contejeani]
MKFKIYRYFTLEKNIILTAESIEYLSKEIKEDSVMNTIVEAYLDTKCTHESQLDTFKKIMKSLTISQKTNFFSVVPSVFTRRCWRKRMSMLTPLISHNPTAIFALEPEKQAEIVGIFYKNKENKFVLEDEENVIPLDLSHIKDNILLIHEMIIGLKGILKNNTFIVHSVLLPTINKAEMGDSTLQSTNLMIIFFYNLNRIELLNKIVNGLGNVGIVVLIGDYNKEFLITLCSYYKNIHFIYVPKPNKSNLETFLPIPAHSKLDLPNLTNTTNPSKLVLHSRTICILGSELCPPIRQNSHLIGENYIESMCRSILSQHSFDPFGYSNLDLPGLCDLFLVAQDYISYNCQISSINFTSIGAFQKEENTFIVYNPQDNTVDVSCVD